MILWISYIHWTLASISVYYSIKDQIRESVAVCFALAYNRLRLPSSAVPKFIKIEPAVRCEGVTHKPILSRIYKLFVVRITSFISPDRSHKSFSPKHILFSSPMNKNAWKPITHDYSQLERSTIFHRDKKSSVRSRWFTNSVPGAASEIMPGIHYTDTHFTKWEALSIFIGSIMSVWCLGKMGIWLG